MLVFVEWQPSLLWRKSAEHAEIDVVVMAHDVRIIVMQHVMLPGPEVRTASQQVEGDAP